MIKVLRNDSDKSIYYEDLEEARAFYQANREEVIQNIDSELKDECLTRFAKIFMAQDMDELADALNYRTDDLDNGSHWYVEEV